MRPGPAPGAMALDSRNPAAHARNPFIHGVYDACRLEQLDSGGLCDGRVRHTAPGMDLPGQDRPGKGKVMRLMTRAGPAGRGQRLAGGARP